MSSVTLPAEADAPLILIVDDDEAMRSSMAFLFDSIGLAAQSYPDAASFLAALPPPEQLRPGGHPHAACRACPSANGARSAQTAHP